MSSIRYILIICAISFISVTGKEQVLSTSDFSFPNTVPGEKYKIEKVLDEETGVITAKCNGKEVSMQEIEKMRLEEEIFLDKKYGAVRGSLRDEIENLKDDELVEVSVSLRPPRIEHLDKTKHTIEECKALAIKIANTKPEKTTDQVMTNAGVQIRKIELEFNDTNDQRVHCRMKKQEIMKLSFLPEIGSIYKFEKQVPCDVPAPLSSHATSAYNPSPLPTGARGQGVAAATFELGIAQNSWSGVVNDFINHFSDRGNLNSSQVATVSTQLTSNDNLWHSQVVFSCLWYTAPAASFHHQIGTSYGYSYNSGHVPYIINNGIKTASISYGNTENAEGSTEMLLMDDFAYSYPFPVFCNPANNEGQSGGIVNWGCYNALSVGSSQHQNLNHYVWANHSSYVNPPAKYGSSNDREMPHVLAPGQWPYLAYNPDCGWDPYFPGEPVGYNYESALKRPLYHGFQGTSFAAPTANGIAACVISSNSAFSVWPEKVRLAMILTSQNCDGGEWISSIDGKDGAGTLSGKDAVWFAQNNTAINPGNSAVQHGSCATSWWENETGTKTFNIKIPSTRPAGKHLRVVLLWDSKPYLPAGKNYLTDLDLFCYRGGTKLKSSSSYNGNIELVDIPRSSLVSNETIQAKVTPFTFRFDPNETNRFFYYAIGWTWVKDQAL